MLYWVEHDTGLVLFGGTKADCIAFISSHASPALLCITDHTGRAVSWAA